MQKQSSYFLTGYGACGAPNLQSSSERQPQSSCPQGWLGVQALPQQMEDAWSSAVHVSMHAFAFPVHSSLLTQGPWRKEGVLRAYLRPPLHRCRESPRCSVSCSRNPLAPTVLCVRCWIILHLQFLPCEVKDLSTSPLATDQVCLAVSVSAAVPHTFGAPVEHKQDRE